MKFGGTSVGSVPALENVIQIVGDTRQKWPQSVVVTSALSGVTNLLLEGSQRALDGDTEFIAQTEAQLLERHQAIANELIPDNDQRAAVMQDIGGLIDTFGDLCRAIAVLGHSTSQSIDAVASLGERMSVRLLAAALRSHGLDAQSIEASDLIVTDDRFQAAHPDFELTAQKVQAGLQPLFDQGCVPVVTGFLAATEDGIITTLGRGGSDYTAAILGATMEADEVWIWTDVDGVMSSDPRVVPDAQTIEELSYREVSELAHFGAKVLHPKTIRPVVEAGITLRVLNTFNASHPGTQIVHKRDASANGSIKAVTAIKDQRMITIEGRGMLGVPGVAARAFGAVAAIDESVILISQASSEQSICFALHAQAADRVITALEQAFAAELQIRDIDRIWATEDVVIVTVVGAGMRNIPGIAGSLFTALGQEKLNVIAIAQGSSEVSISFIVSADDVEDALRAVHSLIK
ncbi:MAG: ACT domain-containing protein [Chloroflexi bacterium]|nr:MAG: ACT domain-containing protein [Chloroflexota bacterium]MBL1197437.1 aspartate kinase [Chloroflexota bacterium]NOH14732.1 aspartate kinase [Chloroflexota bacterium]